jgi:hypothetical protein
LWIPQIPNCHGELEELTKTFMKLKKNANKIKNNGAQRRRDIYAVGWRASNNEGYSSSYYTIEGSMQNTMWVRPQYNEPLKVLTVLISSAFCFSI